MKTIVSIGLILLAGCRSIPRQECADDWVANAFAQYRSSNTITILVGESGGYFIGNAPVTLQRISQLKEKQQILENVHIILDNYSHDHGDIRALLFVVKAQYTNVTCRRDGNEITLGAYPRLHEGVCFQCDVTRTMFQGMANGGYWEGMMMDEQHARQLHDALRLVGYEW
jgi:hypothetical protein